ncbi:metallophosphoesterase [Clostridium lacusfryxellense]|uniref:metallophosphoesterase n=1 Tax=Clostridium lacusfryxellense TaxID=205328 RepID=UPI001C0BFAA7|nr:metallophosphoesterase [Clostridium lacusfryxellense]MBU3110241.1 metallophosphoesterase [Clostridium lacusfryxellense]
MKSKKTFLITTLFILTLIFTSLSYKTAVIKIDPKIKANKNVSFFVASDMHYLAKNLGDTGKAYNTFIESGDGKQLNYIDEIMDAFVVDIKNKKPDVLILSGDLTTNGEIASHIELARKLNEVKNSGTAVYVIPGNHDIFNPYARSFKDDKQSKTDYISDSDFSKIYKDFGYNDAVLRDKKTLSYLATPSSDTWLLMLDTNKYENNINLGYPEAGGKISASTLEWIKKCSDLAKEHNAKIVTVMHQNLLNHVEGITKDFTIDNSKEAVEVFEELGLQITFSGHIHIQDIKIHDNGSAPIYDIVSSALSVYPQQYGILKYNAKAGFDYNTSKVDVQGYAKKLNLQDPNLIDFNVYSKNYYEIQAYKSSINRLYLAEEFTDDQSREVAKTKVKQNVARNSGTTNKDKEAIINSKGFKLLESTNPNYLKKYLDSAYNNGIDNNKLHIPNLK